MKTREEQKAYLAEYYKKNKAEIYAKKREWDLKNKEKNAAYKREHYLKNKDKWAERTKEWNLKNPEKRKEANTQYYRRNREKTLARTGDYQRKNIGHTREKTAHARIKRHTGVPPWVDRDAMRKFYHDCPPGLTVDHIIPIRHPLVCGLHVPWNLQYLTKSENGRKSNKLNG